MRTMTQLRKSFGRAFALTVLFVAGVSGLASAQVPKDMEEFTSHGIKVILRNTSANNVVAVVLGVEGGLAYGDNDNAAIAEGTAGIMTASGSKKYPKEAFRNQLAALSTSVGGSGGLYNMQFTLRTTSMSWNKAWDIFSDVVLNPAFDTVEAQRQQQASENAIESRSSDAESYTEFVQDSLWKLGTNLNRVATVEEVEKLKLSDLAAYHHKMLERSRMILVVVGKVSKADIEKKLAAFDAVPMGSFSHPDVAHINAPTKSSVAMMSRDLPTTYVTAHFSGAGLGTADWWGQRILYEILDKRLFDEIRTKRNLSYAPQAYVTGTHKNYYGVLSLQSVLPDSATGVLLGEVRKLQSTPVGKQELEDAKAGRITTAYYRMQTNLDVATNLLNNQIESGDWRTLFRIVPETEKVTAADVQRAATRYLHHFTFVTLGPDGKATKGAYNFE